MTGADDSGAWPPSMHVSLQRRSVTIAAAGAITHLW
jgi:hypothetical protein